MDAAEKKAIMATLRVIGFQTTAGQLKKLDNLGAFWGSKRSQTLRRIIQEWEELHLSEIDKANRFAQGEAHAS